MENTIDLKWISIVSLGVLFIALINYAFVGGYNSDARDFWGVTTRGFHAVFLFLNVSTLLMATLYMSGKRNSRLYNVAIVFFVLSMIFLFLAVSLALWIEPLMFTFMG